jgi:hypothetical protein
LPKLKLEIDNETDAVKKERLKLIYVLSWKVYKVYYNRLSNILAGKF